MFERLSSEPIYNTRAVVQRTGVPADTFRAWERRYHVPAPSRDSRDRRLYSELDIAVIGWLRDQTRTGVTISQAIALYRSQNGALTRTPTARGAQAARGGIQDNVSNSPFGELRRQLIDALNNLDGTTARQIVQESLSICSIENVCLELLYGAYLEIVDESERGVATTPCDHFARSFIQRKLGALFNQSSPDEGRGPIVAACPAGESHELELLLTSLFLSRHGYKIVYLGANVPTAELVHSVVSTRPSLVLLSASGDKAVDSIGRSIRSLRTAASSHVPIAYGGRVFARRPELRDSVPAHFIGRDAREAVTNIDLLLARVAD